MMIRRAAALEHPEYAVDHTTLRIGTTGVHVDNVPVVIEDPNNPLQNQVYDPAVLLNQVGNHGIRYAYTRDIYQGLDVRDGSAGDLAGPGVVYGTHKLNGVAKRAALRNLGVAGDEAQYEVFLGDNGIASVLQAGQVITVGELTREYVVTEQQIPHAPPPVVPLPIIGHGAAMAPMGFAMQPPMPALQPGVPGVAAADLPGGNQVYNRGVLGEASGPVPTAPTQPAYNAPNSQNTTTNQTRNPTQNRRPVHVRHLTRGIQPVHVDHLKRELSPIHAKGQLKEKPLKRTSKKLPQLKAPEQKITQPPKEVAKVVTPTKKVQQPVKEAVKPVAPQPTVNINVAEKRGGEGEAKSTIDLEELIKILQLLQPKTVTKAPTKIPELIKTIREVEKPIVKERTIEKPVEKESTTYIQIPDIDKTTKLIEEIKAELNKQKPKEEKEGESYTLVQLPDGRKVDRTDETLKVLEEIKAELGKVKNEPQGPTYIQLPEKQEPEQYTFMPLPEVKAPAPEEKVTLVQLPDVKAPAPEEKVTLVQLPEVKAPAPEEKKEEITYVQLPDVKAHAPEKKEENTMIPIPNEKKPEEKKPEEKVSETVAETNHIRGPFPNMGFAPMPMMMAPQPTQPPIIVNQGMSDGESKSNFWSNFFKVLLILLLLASLLGIGYLMYKNSQVQQDSGKQNTEPEPEPKPEPKPEGNTPQQQVQEEVKVEGKPEQIAQVQTNEGETINPVCSEAPAVQLNVDAERVSLGADTGNISQIAKDAIKLEQVGTHNRLVSENGSIDTSRIIINKNNIQVREWGDITKSPKVYEGTIQSNGKALINGTEYTIMDENGKAYSQGALDIASQTSYNRNDNQTLSTDFGTLKQDLQINKNNTFTLDTKTEKGTVIASNTVDDISGNTTMQNILKEKLNDSKITQGEYNRIMDALDDGKLNSSYLRAVSNTSHISLDNNHAVGNSTGV